MNLEIPILIDYDNLKSHHKRRGIQAVTTTITEHITNTLNLESSIGFECRIYGGWHEQSTLTKLAQDVSSEIERGFPFTKWLETTYGRHRLRISAEIALSTLEEPKNYIFNTFRTKQIPYNLRVSNADELGCTHCDCQLQFAKRLLKKGRCPIDGCKHADKTVVHRNEQKIVDAMICCDTLHLVSTREILAIVSGDDDFVPVIRSCIIRGATVFRFRPNTGLASIQNLPRSPGRLFEMDI